MWRGGTVEVTAAGRSVAPPYPAQMRVLQVALLLLAAIVAFTNAQACSADGGDSFALLHR